MTTFMRYSITSVSLCSYKQQLTKQIRSIKAILEANASGEIEIIKKNRTLIVELCFMATFPFCSYLFRYVLDVRALREKGNSNEIYPYVSIHTHNRNGTIVATVALLLFGYF